MPRIVSGSAVSVRFASCGAASLTAIGTRGFGCIGTGACRATTVGKDCTLACLVGGAASVFALDSALGAVGGRNIWALATPVMALTIMIIKTPRFIALYRSCGLCFLS